MEVALDLDQSPAKLSGRRVVYCVGAQRSGTTWLQNNVLKTHPELHAPSEKETHYWNKIRSPYGKNFRRKAKEELTEMDGRGGNKPFRFRSPLRWRAAVQYAERRAAMFRDGDTGHAGYAALLLAGAKPGQMLVDNTPAYALVESGTFVEMASLADARFVYIMRDPVARLWSGVRHRLRRKFERGEVTPEEVLRRFELALERDGDPNLARSDYMRTIQALEGAVGRERILYLFYEALFQQATCDRITDFLGVSRRGGVKFDRRAGKGVEVRIEPDAALRAKARARLAPVYNFVSARFGPEVPANWMQ